MDSTRLVSFPMAFPEIVTNLLVTLKKHLLATGASFVILDGGLKTSSQLQVNVVEDGVAIRVQAEQFRSLCEALNSKEPQNLTIKDSSGAQFFIEWVDNDHNCGEYAIRSPIDGLYLEVFPVLCVSYSICRINFNMDCLWSVL